MTLIHELTIHELPSPSPTHRRFRVTGPFVSTETIASHPRIPPLRERPLDCPWEGYEVAEVIVDHVRQDKPRGECEWTVDVIYGKARSVGQSYMPRELRE